MPFGFLNAIMLAGLAAVVLPPLIHLLTRRRFEVLPWAAMDFLQLGRKHRRRVFWDELLLMAVRMGLIALLVVALAAPVESAGWLSRFQTRPERNIVLVLDSSGSMAIGAGHAAMEKWLGEFVDELRATDRLALVRAGPSPREIAPLSADFAAARSAILGQPPPRGGCDAPGAVALARRILAPVSATERLIVILTDGQKHGWADAATAQRWTLMPPSQGDAIPVVAVNLVPDRPSDVARWSLEPLKTTRALAVVDRPVAIRSEIRRLGTGDLPSPSLRWDVDGEQAGAVTAEANGNANSKSIVLRRTFANTGSHVISVRLSSDGRDDVDRQDLAIEVSKALPVLIVDGDDRPAPERHGVEFLREALAPARDSNPSVKLRVVTSREFHPSMLTREVEGENPRPAVVVLFDVPQLTASQSAAVEQFLQAGGGVLVALGSRADAAHYTTQLHRNGRGWLPAAVGPLTGAGDPAQAAQPLANEFAHAALLMFRQPGSGSLSEARFARWRTLTPAQGSSAAAIARLTGGMPLFVEGRHGQGRVIVSAVSFDDSGPSNVVELPAYAPLLHELVGYLGGARTAELNLSPGQSFIWTLPRDAQADGWVLQPPFGPAQPVAAEAGRIVINERFEPGVYSLSNAKGPRRWFVVAPDRAENDLMPLDDTDRERFQRWLPGLRWVASPADALGLTQSGGSTELGWLAFVGVIALLCTELWMTRRRAAAIAA